MILLSLAIVEHNEHIRKMPALRTLTIAIHPPWLAVVFEQELKNNNKLRKRRHSISGTRASDGTGTSCLIV
jgi:hypothetical protein